MKRSNDCKYNGMIECQADNRRCERCGWNPTVKKHRMRRIVKIQSDKAGSVMRNVQKNIGFKFVNPDFLPTKRELTT